MSRVKRGTVTKKRHNRLFKLTKGFWGQRKNIFRRAKETLLRAMAFAFKGRKLLKRDMRALFITRIKAAANQHDMSYSTFIHGLKKSHVELNRKMLSQLAVYDAPVFAELAAIART
ncbi:MAG: 50S ribosomal protein L20 [Candidatus Babeliaceae bacterium]|nr:50S ribosomal protein L20 [Candidatus Babeliaceae bacterium]